ncbi:MBL fold metallo-hydrolase [Virgibacillus salexigens]|uniref:MBL fold metallo-hydrolase n=1 Tax=Virgibacillus salexigens TaxID=61016 RepID=UPI00190AE475|nr:MBL fold metallo-hydrolase [Virgibacillus salexigens]
MSQNPSGNPSLVQQISNAVVPEGAIMFWHLGQSGVVLKVNDVICYIDPYLSNYIEEESLVYPPNLLKRNFDSPISPEAITHANLVLITHEHVDHLDPKTLKAIMKSSPEATFICPAPSTTQLKTIGIHEDRIHSALAYEVIQFANLSITPVPAKHEDFFTDQKQRHYYLGYVIETNNETIYHAGDTVLYKELIDFLKPRAIDVGFLPINGQDWKRSNEGALGNMNFRDAIELSQQIDLDLIVPVHYDLFQSNTESPAFFVDYLYRNYPFQKFKMMVPGEMMVYWSKFK